MVIAARTMNLPVTSLQQVLARHAEPQWAETPIVLHPGFRTSTRLTRSNQRSGLPEQSYNHRDNHAADMADAHVAADETAGVEV